jgi:UPF0271 protein
LSNVAAEEPDVAAAIARATRVVARDLVFLAIAGTALEAAGRKAGLRVANEIYADRAYTDQGLLVPRSQEGAVLHDIEAVATRVLAMVQESAVIAVSGRRIPVGIDSICVHGDTPNAVAMARALRTRLESAGFSLKPFVDVLSG